MLIENFNASRAQALGVLYLVSSFFRYTALKIV